MKTDDAKIRGRYIVVLLENPSIHIQLDTIVPDNGVGHFLQRIPKTTSITVFFRSQLLGSLPVEDTPVCATLRHGIDGASKILLISVDSPFRSMEYPSLRTEVTEKLREHANLWRVEWHTPAIEQTFAVGVHPRALCGSFPSIPFPLLEDLRIG